MCQRGIGECERVNMYVTFHFVFCLIMMMNDYNEMMQWRDKCAGIPFNFLTGFWMVGHMVSFFIPRNEHSIVGNLLTNCGPVLDNIYVCMPQGIIQWSRNVAAMCAAVISPLRAAHGRLEEQLDMIKNGDGHWTCGVTAILCRWQQTPEVSMQVTVASSVCTWPKFHLGLITDILWRLCIDH